MRFPARTGRGERGPPAPTHPQDQSCCSLSGAGAAGLGLSPLALLLATLLSPAYGTSCAPRRHAAEAPTDVRAASSRCRGAHGRARRVVTLQRRPRDVVRAASSRCRGAHGRARRVVTAAEAPTDVRAASSRCRGAHGRARRVVTLQRRPRTCAPRRHAAEAPTGRRARRVVTAAEAPTGRRARRVVTAAEAPTGRRARRVVTAAEAPTGRRARRVVTAAEAPTDVRAASSLLQRRPRTCALRRHCCRGAHGRARRVVTAAEAPTGRARCVVTAAEAPTDVRAASSLLQRRPRDVRAASSCCRGAVSTLRQEPEPRSQCCDLPVLPLNGQRERIAVTL
ncbi:uncharacterized protein LOC118605236 [Rousettus aegyptiacus]|uniref:uncharacterized protein LOC118605236 n=1 Tax=Rousettus aegyptiacus TaxID=9407 RepID=UPI00168D8A45|nr:uncharacterized protein LOC118605236 [Rousettus aegyptiacus]